MPLPYQDAPRLADLTTLGVGGSAERLYQPLTARETVELVQEARNEERPLLPIGSGSNLLCADDGFDGWLVRSANWSMEVEYIDKPRVRLHVGAGVDWDELVTFAVTERFAGLECLSGIPGLAGAAPIQNIGAYGAEVSDLVHAVDVVDRRTGLPMRLAGSTCGFGYRSSRFKEEWRGKYLITGLSLNLVLGGEAKIAYAEVRELLGLRDGGGAPPLAEVRDAVLALRARKSMLLRADDSNRRSAGSFFVNPVVSSDAAERVRARANGTPMPAWPTDDGAVKLSAAWLIQHAGFARGHSFGAAALSSRHTLALINRGDATASDLIDAARTIRDGVLHRWGVRLHAEPEFVGFHDHPLDVPSRSDAPLLGTLEPE
jgi:UDP-N-acetylmuramate dehydrogenase